MAQRTVVELTDDLTGEPADETLDFAFDGKSYSIDLSAKNADKFRKVIAPYVKVAHGEKPSASGHRGSTRAATRSDGPDPKVVRAWAVSAGYTVSARGRVSSDIVDAYRAAH